MSTPEFWVFFVWKIGSLNEQIRFFIEVVRWYDEYKNIYLQDFSLISKPWKKKQVKYIIFAYISVSFLYSSQLKKVNSWTTSCGHLMSNLLTTSHYYFSDSFRG